MAKAESAQIQQDFLPPDQETLYREVLQQSYNTIFMASPLQLQGPELLVHLEQIQEPWAPDNQCPANDASEGLVNQAVKEWPETRIGWNSYRSPVSVPSSDSSSSDDESTSEKEERNVKQEGFRVTKPRAGLLGKCVVNHWKEEASESWRSQPQGIIGYANENDGDSSNSPQGINVQESHNVCCECGKSFGRRSSLNRHLKIHSNEKPYKCSTCDKCFIEKSNLNAHIRKKHKRKSHSRREHYECSECGENFVTRASLTEHQRAHTNETTYPCPICKKNYMEERYLVRHLMVDHSGANLFKCSVCGKGFMKEKDLVRHRIMSHIEDHGTSYSGSGENYREKSFLIKPQRLHLSEFTFKWPECKKNSRDNRSVDNQKMHEKETHTPYQGSVMEGYDKLCPVCGKYFKNERCFANHQRMHLREQQHEQTGEGNVVKEEVQLTRNQIIQVNMKHSTCFDCGKPLCTNAMLARQPKSKMEDNFNECHDCGKIFSNTQCFSNHQRIHTEEQSKNASLQSESMLSAGQQETPLKERSYKCSNCGRAYTTEYNLKRHQHTHSECRPKNGSSQGKESACRWPFTKVQKDQAKEQLPQHKCSYCGKVFQAKSVLNRHQQIHIKGKPYKCNVCGKGFAHRYTLAHHQEAHEEEKVYQHKCSLCGKAFRTHSSLRRHQQLHMGSKPYSCDICGKAFTYRYALTNHREIHVEGRSYKCSFCWKAFRTNYSLSRHKRIHMEIRSYQCSICGKAFGTKYSLSRHQDMHMQDNPDNLSSTGKDPADRSVLAKNQASDTEENSNNWSGISTLSGHQELHMEGKNLECSERGGGSTCTKHHFEENSSKGLECERAFIGNLMLPKAQISLAKGHNNEWFENSVYSRHQGVCTEGKKPECSGNVGSSDLARHQSSHLEENSAEGFDGGKRFRDCAAFTKDQAGQPEGNVNKWTDRSVSSEYQGLHKEENPPECPKNEGTFMGKIALSKHQSTRGEENSIGGFEGKEPFKDSSSHSSHQGIITDKQSYTCSNCGKSWKNKYSLMRHQKTHSEERPYQCQMCKKSFHHPKDLTRHQITHSDLRPYQCSECEKQFKSKASLLKHQKAHKGEKPYCCSYCGKRVTTKSILQCHLRIHTGERPYKCTECGKGYITNWFLKKHLKSHLKTNS
ncbi:zinc finger protein 11-like [Elgaria multicarinata webbii]|uniref:zinc finger protein 11-like n=1 Tax=Elgaria multicarinata webbii TaxID=159646 RepID=UPI002FCCBA14